MNNEEQLSNDENEFDFKLNFITKISLADENIQKCYVELRNEFNKYENVLQRMTNSTDNYSFKKEKIAKISLSGKTLKLHLALKMDDFDVKIYHQRDLSGKKKYEDVPFAFKVKSGLAVKRAKILIKSLMERYDAPANKKYIEYDILDVLKDLDQRVVCEVQLTKLFKPSITALKASNAISNEIALMFLETEENLDNEIFEKEVIFIDDISKAFNDNDEINLLSLKEKGILQENVMAYQVAARGTLNKKLFITANDFSIDAIKMIVLTKGKAIQLK